MTSISSCSLTLKHLFPKKQNIVLSANSSIDDALKLMSENMVSSVVIVDKDNYPEGIFTERDGLKIVSDGKSKDTQLSDVMSRNLFTVSDSINIHDAYILSASRSIRHLIVVDKNGYFENIISEGDFLRQIGLENFSGLSTIKSIIKDIPLIIFDPNMSIKHVSQLMNDKNSDYAIIDNQNGEYSIVYERSITRYISKENSSYDMPISLLSSQDITYIEKTATLNEAANVLSKHNIHHLVVLNKKKEIIGLVKRSDVLKAVHSAYYDILVQTIEEKNSILKQLQKSQKELIAKQNQLDLLLKNIPDMVWLKDVDGIFRFCNPAFEFFFGAKEKDIIGKNDYDFVSKELADFFIEKDKQAIANKISSINTEWVTLAGNGKKILLETIKTPLFNDNGAPFGVLGIARDITELWNTKEELKEREEISSAIIDQSYEAILLIDCETTEFTKFNDAASSLLGYTRDEFEKLRLKDVQPDDFDEAQMYEKLNFLIQGNGGSFEHRHKCKDGKILDVVVSNKAVDIKDKKYLVAVWHDVTQSKNLEKELKQKLDEELRKNREKDLILVNQSRLASMGEMMSNIAHQWRQPLNEISALKDSLVEDYYFQELTNEKVDHFAEVISRSLGYMSHTIDDFRDFFKPNKEKHLFDIKDSVKEALELMQDAIKSLSIKLKVDIQDAPMQVFGVKNEILQVLINILNNAKDTLKLHNAQDNRLIEITSSIKNDKIIIDISDNGGGIPQNIINKIFDPYFTTKHASQGTGLGLYMAKTIVEQNFNGKLSVYNNSKFGATFLIELSLN